MAQTSVRKLDDHDPFPPLEISLVGGGTVRVPEDTNDYWTVLLVYRGYF